MRRRFKLLKDSPELKAGAILEENCDNGDQDFTVISKEWSKVADQGLTYYTRKTVIDQPEWFEEQHPVYLPMALYEKLKTLLSS